MQNILVKKGFSTIEAVQSTIASIHKSPSTPTEIELIRFIVSMNFY